MGFRLRRRQESCMINRCDYIIMPSGRLYYTTFLPRARDLQVVRLSWKTNEYYVIIIVEPTTSPAPTPEVCIGSDKYYTSPNATAAPAYCFRA